MRIPSTRHRTKGMPQSRAQRRQFMQRNALGSFELQILAVLLNHDMEAYGVTIAKHIEEKTATHVSIGALYTVLSRLEQKGFVSSSWGAPTKIRGGRKKRYYKIEQPGITALHHTQNLLARFSANLK